MKKNGTKGPKAPEAQAAGDPPVVVDLHPEDPSLAGPLGAVTGTAIDLLRDLGEAAADPIPDFELVLAEVKRRRGDGAYPSGHLRPAPRRWWRKPSVAVAGVAAAVAAAAAVALVLWAGPHRPRPRLVAYESASGLMPEEPGVWKRVAPGTELEEGTTLAVTSEAIELNDPTTASLRVASRSRVQVVAWNAEAAILRLDTGRVEVKVRPRPPGVIFAIQTEFARVQVVGTSFVVSHDPEGATTVQVRSGIVRVRAMGGAVLEGGLSSVSLRAGEEVRVAPAERLRSANASRGLAPPAATEEVVAEEGSGADTGPAADPSVELVAGSSETQEGAGSSTPPQDPPAADPAVEPPAVAEPSAAPKEQPQMKAHSTKAQPTEARGSGQGQRHTAKRSIDAARRSVAGAHAPGHGQRLPSEARSAPATDPPPDSDLRALRARVDRLNERLQRLRETDEKSPVRRWSRERLSGLERAKETVRRGETALRRHDWGAAAIYFGKAISAADRRVAQDAIVGMMRARLGQGRFGEVRNLADHYARRFPNGARGDEVEALRARALER